MKNILLIPIICLSLTAFATGTYEKAMKATLEQLNQAQNKADFINTANKFARIARAEADKWLPYYYAAYGKIVASAMEENPEQKDLYLDEAQIEIDQLLQLEYDKVEVLALQSFLAMMRISVDPATRGQTYSMKSAAFIEEALQITENNPRVILMKGYLMHGSAKFMKTDLAPACAQFDKALQLFDKQDNPPEPFWPTWGKMQAVSMQQECEANK